MTESFAREKAAALQCAKAAAKVCVMVQSELDSEGSINKADKTPVTIADYGSQAVICRILKEAFASDIIVAEETADLLGEPENDSLLARVTNAVKAVFSEASGDLVRQWIDLGAKNMADRYWCLDPIDGTKGFLRGDQYAIALALVVDGTVRLGVLACPNLPEYMNRPDGPRGVIFSAVKGEGSFQMPLGGTEMVPIRVVSERTAKAVRFCESFESAHSNLQRQEAIGRRLGIVEAPIRMDSQAKYGIVARGDAAIYLRLPSPKTPDYREKVWDHAAGTILVEEAGGRVTDANGKALSFAAGYRLVENTGVIATNGALHDQVLAALSDPSASQPVNS